MSSLFNFFIIKLINIIYKKKISVKEVISIHPGSFPTIYSFLPSLTIFFENVPFSREMRPRLYVYIETRSAYTQIFYLAKCSDVQPNIVAESGFPVNQNQLNVTRYLLLTEP